MNVPDFNGDEKDGFDQAFLCVCVCLRFWSLGFRVFCSLGFEGLRFNFAGHITGV